MLVSVWMNSLRDAHMFINEHGLSSSFVQFVEDKQMKFSYWVILKITNKVLNQLVEKTNPKHTIIW